MSQRVPDALMPPDQREPRRVWPVRHLRRQHINVWLWVAGGLVIALGIGSGTRLAFAQQDQRPEGVSLAMAQVEVEPTPPLPSATQAPAAPAPSVDEPTPEPTPSPTERPGGQPGPDNTGPLPGTEFTVLTGDQVLTTDGQVLSGVDVHGMVIVKAKDVRIENSIIRGGAATTDTGMVFVRDGGSVTIVDTEIAPDVPNKYLDGVIARNTTLTRVNIHGVVDGLKAFDGVLVEDSYIHDLAWFPSHPSQNGGPTHNDCVQTLGSQDVTLRHNTLDAVGMNAVFQVTQDLGTPSTGILVEDNWIDGGACSLNFAHKGGPVPMTGIDVVGNRFGRGSTYGCPIIVSTQTELSVNDGNVWADTGEPIPPPTRHD